jgi:hypothetical protein
MKGIFLKLNYKCKVRHSLTLGVWPGAPKGLAYPVSFVAPSWSHNSIGGGGCDRMVVWFTTTYVISAYHHLSCEFEPRSWRVVLDIKFSNKVCQWLPTGR